MDNQIDFSFDKQAYLVELISTLTKEELAERIVRLVELSNNQTKSILELKQKLLTLQQGVVESRMMLVEISSSIRILLKNQPTVVKQIDRIIDILFKIV